VYRSKGCVVREDRKKGGNKGGRNKNTGLRVLSLVRTYTTAASAGRESWHIRHQVRSQNCSFQHHGSYWVLWTLLVSIDTQAPSPNLNSP